MVGWFGQIVCLRYVQAFGGMDASICKEAGGVVNTY